MNRPRDVLRDACSAIRVRSSVVAAQPDRTVLLGAILLASTFSAATGYVLNQYFAVDVLSSLTFSPNDCLPYWGMQVGRHCFSDYGMVTSELARSNPWEPYEPYLTMPNPGPAAVMVPHAIFAVPAAWLHAPQLGMYAYLFALTIAVLTPAVWAARGARGLERVVVFVACGAAAIPAWVAVDRANSVGFVAPIALVFLVALLRKRWRLVAIMVVLAALVKPQFALLVLALFAARQWRWGGITLCGLVISHLAAYLLWWRHFPSTIGQTIRNAQHYVGSFQSLVATYNVSFQRSVFFIPDEIVQKKMGHIPEGFLAGPRSLTGTVVLVVVVVCVLALGRRVPPVMVGIVLLPTAALFPALTGAYYLIFAVPVAALVARDPDGLPGSGMFDRLAAASGRRRAVGIVVSLVAAFSLAQIALPSAMHLENAVPVVATTALLMPLLWLVVCAVVFVSYARRPAPFDRDDGAPDEQDSDTADDRSPPTAELMTKS